MNLRNGIGRRLGWSLGVAAACLLGSALPGEAAPQLECFRLLPAQNQVFSPGMNRGTAEGEWLLCHAHLAHASLDSADVHAGVAGDGTYRVSFTLPTYSQRNGANGISDIALSGTFGTAPVAPIPAGHPAAGTLLGAFGDVSDDAVSPAGTVFHTGAPIFPGAPGGAKSVVGVIVSFDLAFGVPQNLVDVFFAVRLAPDGLKKITGANGGQGFPGTASNNGTSGAAQYFSGPAPIMVGFFTGDPTGVATVPVKVIEANGGRPVPFASLEGSKFCDVDGDGECAGEPLVDGTEIIITLDTIEGEKTYHLFTGTSGQSSLTLTRLNNGGGTIEETFGTAQTGRYSFVVACDVLSPSGGPTEVTIEEVFPAGFDHQTAPIDDTDGTDGVTAADGVYTVTVECGTRDTFTALDFGNVALEAGHGDPNTMGFWGSAVKKALHSQEEGSSCEPPGGDKLPFAEFETPEELADLIQESVDGCSALGSVDRAQGTDATLCAATAILPPGEDVPVGSTNALAQLLAFLLNVESGRLPGGTFVDPVCLGFEGDVVSVGELGAAACEDPDSFQALLDAINNLDPGETGETECLEEATCPVSVSEQVCF